MDRWARLELGKGAAWSVVAGVGALLVFQSMGTSPLLDPNEAKHALIAKHTLEADRWLEPILGQTPYHDKPSLFYILVAACYRAFGISEFSARLVPALSIWGTLLFTYGLASRRSTQAGLLAAFLLASSLFFVHLGRFTNLDGLFTLALTGSLFTAVKHLPADGAWRIPFAAFAWLAVAILIKGPVAALMLALPAAIAAYRPGLDWKRVATGAALVAALVAAWVIPVAWWHLDYLVDFIWLHNLERYFGDVEKFHLEPVLFFVPIIFGALLPWSTLLPMALVRAFGAFREELFLAVYALAVVVFFSLSSGKLATYVVPAFPALSVVVAWWSWDRLSEPGSKGRGAALLGVGVVSALAPLAIGAAAIAAPELLGAAACLLPASALAVAVWLRRASFDSGTDIAVLCSGGLLVASLALGRFGGEAAGRFSSDRELAALAAREGRPDKMVVYRVRPFSFLFYTGWDAVYKVTDDQYREAITGPGSVLILTKEKRLEPLAAIVPGLQFETVARNSRHLLLRPSPEQSR